MPESDYSNYDNVEKVPAGACYNFWKCGNITPGGVESANELCNECIDWVRETDLTDVNNEASLANA